MTPNAPQQVCPHVAVCVDNGRAHGRGVLRGIADYVDAYGPWSLFVDPQADSVFPEGRSKNWSGDGILTYIECPTRAERLLKSGIPTVELFAFRADQTLPVVASDDFAIGKLAAEHLIERHFRSFAFTGYSGSLWSERRRKGFASAVEAARLLAPSCYDVVRPRTLVDWETVQSELTEWMRSLPKPVGLMACSDHHAQRVLDACRRAGTVVPEEVAVIGVDNNEEICRLSNPPLTSVIDDSRRVGYEGARLLHRLMTRKNVGKKKKTILIPPLGIATRRSTDVTAIDDRLMAEVLRYIREHACNGLNMKQLPGKFGMSRSVFYRRFQQATQRSPHEEVLRVQLDRAKALLAQTKLPLDKVATLAAFPSSAYLSVVFRREINQTPGQFRSLAQSR